MLKCKKGQNKTGKKVKKAKKNEMKERQKNGKMMGVKIEEWRKEH